ncbi:MAG: dCTP deaminase [Bosea sp. (in: a-proteobacteria)]
MILTDRDILAALLGREIFIAPQPALGAYSSTSVDLTLSRELKVFRAVNDIAGEVVDPAQSGFCFKSAMARFTSPARIGPEGFDLKPQEMVLAWTAETIDLGTAAKLAARVEGKSSLARFGLAIHVTAPTIHAGFAGSIQLEIVNHGPVSVRLRAGMRICQLILEQTASVAERGYAGQFQGQTPQSMEPENAKAPRGSTRGLVRAVAGNAGSDRQSA